MALRTLEPFDPAVVAPWVLGSGAHGVLLLHGFAGTPPELRRLGEHLAAHGYRCRGPALAGHAGTPDDLRGTTRLDWIRSAREAMDTLAGECDEVMAVGQSMGGTLALHLAAADLRIRAVATLAAPVFLTGVAPLVLPVARRLLRWQRPGQDIDLYDQSRIDELYSLGLRPMSAIGEFGRLIGEVRDELASVRAPVLVMHGGRDRTIHPSNAEEIARRLVCSAEVERHLFPRSGHGMSVDIDRDDIQDRVLGWCDRHRAVVVEPLQSAIR
ncbi:MAG: alpha/beta fold hydrolase [Candidatus Dormibacteraeota bacterium]|nr:alpha/beta fold hydrolase [Candidatus Dormibacteraeota bacterium]